MVHYINAVRCIHLVAVLEGQFLELTVQDALDLLFLSHFILLLRHCSILVYL